MKFAEAGILITLVLALAVFVGVRLNQDTGPGITAVDTVVALPADEEAITPETLPVSADPETTLTAGEAAPAEMPAGEPEFAPEPAPVTYAAAEKTFFSGDYEGAAEMFSRYTDQHQENAWGYYMLGLAEWKAGDADGAEDAFLHALALKPDHLKSLVNYSRVLIDQDRNEEARAQLEMALAINPNSLEATRVLGRVQHNLGQLDLAAGSYRTVLLASDQDVWALNNLGLVLIEQEQFAEALAPLAKASLLAGDVACIQNNLGIALERTGHYIAAGEAYARAVEAEAGHAKAAASLARVAGLTESPDQAPVDLAAVAAGFMAHPELDSLEADMEVASANESSAPVIDEPETDGSRNR